MSKDVVKKAEAGLPVPVDFYDEQGVGLEEADSESYAIPFLQVLQSLSPQLKKKNAAYIKGAAEGDFLQTVTKETFNGEKGVLIIPVHFTRLFTEWVPRDQGGGFRGVHAQSDPIVATGLRDDSGRLHIENGNILTDTRYHYCLLLTEEGPQAVLLSFTSTQIKKSKQWLTVMRSLKLANKQGRLFNPPTYSHIYRLTTAEESNSKGTWSGVQITKERVLDLTSESDQLLYLAAKEFREQVAAGKAQIVPVDEEAEQETTDF